LNWGAQHWTQDSRWGLTRAEQCPLSPRGSGWGRWLACQGSGGSRGDIAGLMEGACWGEEELMRWQRKKMECNLSGNYISGVLICAKRCVAILRRAVAVRD